MVGMNDVSVTKVPYRWDILSGKFIPLVCPDGDTRELIAASMAIDGKHSALVQQKASCWY